MIMLQVIPRTGTRIPLHSKIRQEKAQIPIQVFNERLKSLSSFNDQFLFPLLYIPLNKGDKEV